MTSRFCLAVVFICLASLRAEPDRKLLTGKAAMGDWTSDAPEVRRKITVADLPPPGSNALSINFPRVVARPSNAQLRVPPGFKIDLYSSGFRDPRFLLTAPNGDLFVVESRANSMPTGPDKKFTRGEFATRMAVFFSAKTETIRSGA